MIKDYDMKSQVIIRKSQLHNKQRVTSMISQGPYLISCSPENGLVIVYDYKNQQIHRELKTRTEHIERPVSLHLMKGDKLLALCDSEVVSILNIEKSTVEKHTNDNKQVTRLFKLPLTDESSGMPAFAGATSTGLLKIWSEVHLDSANNLVREDMDPYRIDNLKILKSSGIS